MKKMNIKNIIFDLGGVIIDIDKDRAIKRFKEIGLNNPEKYIGAYKQEGIFLLLEEGKITVDEFYESFRKLAGLNASNEQIDYAWHGFILPVKEERLNFILNLRKQYKLYLLSNTNPIIMKWARSGNFSESGKSLDQYFDKLYLSYEMGIVKPEPEIFELVIQDKILPEETLFLDDGKSNIETANKLGFKTILVEEGVDFRHYMDNE